MYYLPALAIVILLFSSITSNLAATSALSEYQAIVVPDKCAAPVRQAAEDLRHTLEKMTGRTIPLQSSPKDEQKSFFVREITDPDKPREWWRIRSENDGIYLEGDQDGVWHAVSLFLENYAGVRWLWPGPFGEVIPNTPNLTLPDIKEEGAPHFIRRELAYLGNVPYWAPGKREELEIWKKRTRQGNQLKANFGHAWSHIIPPEKYFASHPEWFALVDGKRIPAQLCTSNPEMRDEFVKNLIADADKSKLDVVSVSANDGSGFCECDLCKAKGAIGDAYWDFVNDIALRFKKERPNVGIGTLAYTEGRQPPEKIAKLPDNVFVSMTTYATSLESKKGQEDYARFIEAWKSKGVRIVMREYWGMHYFLDLPVLYPREIAQTIKEANKAGLVGAYGECGKNFSNMALNYYVLTHLLWNPERDVDDVINEFYKAFGVAEAPIRKYFENYIGAVHDYYLTHEYDGKYVSMINLYGDMFTTEINQRGMQYLKEADELAGDDQALKNRIQFLRIGCRYTAIMSELLGLYSKLGRTGFPLEGFEWEATARRPRQVVESPNMDYSRSFFEARLREPFSYTLEQKDEWMKRAWELGQERIKILNENRANFALDEFLPGYADEVGIRQWHRTINDYLGKPDSAIETLIYTHPQKK